MVLNDQILKYFTEIVKIEYQGNDETLLRQGEHSFRECPFTISFQFLF